MVLRYLPHAVDTVLLTTALMLTTVIHQYPFSTGWLTAKVVLLVAYIVLGSIALKRGRTRRIRIAALRRRTGDGRVPGHRGAGAPPAGDLRGRLGAQARAALPHGATDARRGARLAA